MANMKEISQPDKNFEEAYRNLIDASLSPLMIINFDGEITHMNEATANILGVSCETIKGTHFFDHFREPEKAREAYQNVFVKGSVLDFPLTIRSHDGKFTEVLFNGSSYNDGRGNILGALIVSGGHILQRNFENKLIEVNNLLEKKWQMAKDQKFLRQ